MCHTIEPTNHTSSSRRDKNSVTIAIEMVLWYCIMIKSLLESENWHSSKVFTTSQPTNKPANQPAICRSYYSCYCILIELALVVCGTASVCSSNCLCICSCSLLCLLVDLLVTSGWTQGMTWKTHGNTHIFLPKGSL